MTENDDRRAKKRIDELDALRKAASDGATAIKINRALDIARHRHGHGGKLGVLAALPLDGKVHRFQCSHVRHGGKFDHDRACGEIVEVTDMEASL